MYRFFNSLMSITQPSCSMLQLLLVVFHTDYQNPNMYDIHSGPFCEKGREFWYIAKDMPFYGIKAYLYRVIDAWRVLTDKSRAYHYKQDE